MIKAAVETLKLLLVGERNWLFVFIDERNTDIFLWNAKQSGDFRSKIPPAWFLIKTSSLVEASAFLSLNRTRDMAVRVLLLCRCGN